MPDVVTVGKVLCMTSGISRRAQSIAEDLVMLGFFTADRQTECAQRITENLRRPAVPPKQRAPKRKHRAGSKTVPGFPQN